MVMMLIPRPMRKLKVGSMVNPTWHAKDRSAGHETIITQPDFYMMSVTYTGWPGDMGTGIQNVGGKTGFMRSTGQEIFRDAVPEVRKFITLFTLQFYS